MHNDLESFGTIVPFLSYTYTTRIDKSKQATFHQKVTQRINFRSNRQYINNLKIIESKDSCSCKHERKYDETIYIATAHSHAKINQIQKQTQI